MLYLIWGYSVTTVSLILKYTMKLNFTLILTLSVFCLSLNAQDKNFKFSKVPQSDVEMVEYELEPESEAVVLGHTLKLFLTYGSQYQMVYTHHKRIKIFKESAFDLGKVELYYYSEDNTESIRKLKAVITYPDGSQYSLNRKEFYNDEIDDKYKKITFTYPKLSEGCIIEYSYQLVSKQVALLEDFNYQEDIPVRYAHMELDLPEHIDYTFINKGDFSLVERKGEYMLIENVPSMKEEAHITTMNDYRGTIKTQIRGYTDGDGRYVPILSTWGKVSKGLMESNFFAEQYTRKTNHSKILNDTKALIDKSLEPREQVLALQKILLDKVTCNNELGIYSRESLNKAWKEGEATCTELNFMMIALLRSLDIPAYPMLISTRSNGRVFTTYPFLSQFSYAIVRTEIDGKPFLIDVSDKHRPPGVISHAALSREGFVVDDTYFHWESIEAFYSMDAFFCQFKIEEEALSGTIAGKYTNYNALPERRLYEDDAEGKHWEKRLQSKFPSSVVVEAKLDEGANLYAPLKDKVEVVIPEACVVANDIMYIDPYIYSNYTENPFKLNERKFPVDFGNPRGETYVVLIEIPEGYSVEEIPESTKIITEDKMASYTLSCSTSGNRIQIQRRIEFKKPIYSPDEYLALKKIFDMILEKDGEQIVLKKA